MAAEKHLYSFRPGHININKIDWKMLRKKKPVYLEELEHPKNLQLPKIKSVVDNFSQNSM